MSIVKERMQDDAGERDTADLEASDCDFPEEALKRFWFTYESRAEAIRIREKIDNACFPDGCSDICNNCCDDDGLDECQGISQDEYPVEYPEAYSGNNLQDSKRKRHRNAYLCKEEMDLRARIARENFWKYYTAQPEPDEATRKVFQNGLPEEDSDDIDEETGADRNGGGKVSFIHRRFSLPAAAAIFCVVIVLCLGMGMGVYAEQAGFFHLYRLKNGDLEVVTSPSESVSGEEWLYERYASVEDVPIKYLRFVCTPNEIPEDFSLMYVEIMDKSLSVLSETFYQNSEGNYIKIHRQCFDDVISVRKYQVGTFYEEVLSMDIQGIEIIFYQTSGENDVEYAAFFYYENSKYWVVCNTTLEEIEVIVTDLIDEI